jgi:hypothetical protein
MIELTTAEGQVQTWMKRQLAAAHREAHERLAVSIDRCRALLAHLEEAQRQVDPYDWLATHPTLDQQDPRLRRGPVEQP